MVIEDGIVDPATLRLVQTSDPIVGEGGLAVTSVRGDHMMFSEGKGDDSIFVEFRRVKSR